MVRDGAGGLHPRPHLNDFKEAACLECELGTKDRPPFGSQLRPFQILPERCAYLKCDACSGSGNLHVYSQGAIET